VKDLYNKTLMVLNTAFQRLELAVDAPDYVQRGSHSVFAYKDKTIGTALIQKLARVVSSLAATSVLLQSGLYQKVGVMFRILDELGEDIQFLRLGTLGDGPTQLHLDFLDAFYMEEFDKPDDPRVSSQKRPMIAREKIQAALANAPGNGINPSDEKETRRTISKAYGGYIHAASERVLEMVEGYTDGRRPKYRVLGMLGTPRQMQ